VSEGDSRQPLRGARLLSEVEDELVLKLALHVLLFGHEPLLLKNLPSPSSS
jgi:hypothetical protein